MKQQAIDIHLLLFLADTHLILSQRNAENCAHGPVLEQDIAITNITLDLLGQARNFYQYAARLLNKQNPSTPATEDSLAYLRTEREFKNLLLTELPNGDWGQVILRQYLFSEYTQLYFTNLAAHPDADLAAIAEKSLKEIAYHVKWSKEWVIRLGDGTEESRQRMLHAMDAVWAYTGELFEPVDFESENILLFHLQSIQPLWWNRVKETLEEATLQLPGTEVFMQTGGKQGVHTEHLGYILADLQYLQRSYPGAEW